MSFSSNQVKLTPVQAYHMSLAGTGSKYSHSCCALSTLASISSVALFIIACLATKGAVSSSLLCKATIGLSVGSTLLSAMAGSFKNQFTGKIKKFPLALNIALTITFIALAALGLSGTLSTTQVGWGLLNSTLFGVGIGVIQGSCCSQNAIAENAQAALSDPQFTQRHGIPQQPTLSSRF